MDILITIILLVLGIILILAEIFLLPGITVAILGGAIFIGGGLYYAYSHLGLQGGNIALAVSIITFIVTFVWLIKSKAINKIGLDTNIESSVADETIMSAIKEGDEGITISRLNPIGKVKIGTTAIEAKTLGDFLDEDVEIVVLKVYPTQVVVKPQN